MDDGSLLDQIHVTGGEKRDASNRWTMARCCINTSNGQGRRKQATGGKREAGKGWRDARTEGQGWTMARCWIKYKSWVVRKGMQATGGRWPVAVSIQATGEGDASKQREENEKQARMERCKNRI